MGLFKWLKFCRAEREREREREREKERKRVTWDFGAFFSPVVSLFNLRKCEYVCLLRIMTKK